MKHGIVSTRNWSGKSAVFLMESALTSHGSSKLNKKLSDGRGILDYSGAFQVAPASYQSSTLAVVRWPTASEN